MGSTSRWAPPQGGAHDIGHAIEPFALTTRASTLRQVEMASETAKPNVLCAGLLVADLFIPPLARLPAAGELLAVGDFLADTGGCAANTVTALAKLGVSATVAGTVGQDIFGDFVLQDLARKGADTRGITRSRDTTPRRPLSCPSMGEDRRYIHTFGANADFSANDIDRALLAQARVFCVGGYLILPSLKPDELAALFQICTPNGTRTVLDVVVPAGQRCGSIDGGADTGIAADRLLFTQQRGSAADDWQKRPTRAGRTLLKAGCGTVVITMGAHGTLLMNAHETIEQPAFKVNVVDGSGAGDAFAAGLILGLLAGWPLARTREVCQRYRRIGLHRARL